MRNWWFGTVWPSVNMWHGLSKSGLNVQLRTAFYVSLALPMHSMHLCVMRFECFKLPLSASSQAYMQKILSLASVQQWIAEARQEQMFVAFDEPYRKSRDEYLNP